MYYSVIEWTAKLRAWAASEKRKEIGRETFHAQRAIRNFAALSDPNIRAWRMREEERKLARLQGELRGAMAAEIDCAARYRIIMGQDA